MTTKHFFLSSLPYTWDCCFCIVISVPPPCPSSFRWNSSAEGMDEMCLSPQVLLTYVYEIMDLSSLSLRSVSNLYLELNAKRLLFLHYPSLHVTLSHLIGTPGWFKLGEIPCKTIRLLMCNVQPYTIRSAVSQVCFSGSVLLKTFANIQ